MRRKRSSCLRALVLVSGILAASAGTAAPEEVIDMSLEDLLKVDVTSASRKRQRLHDVAAAVYVISRDDIERSGATSVPEALRMVPGVQVARLSNNRWAVSARGFNGRFANKLLVLMDGRSIYSPLFSGVLWEVEETLLEDVERIEVIRGPGAAMWGANAVNGVINIITRKARDTQGTMVTAGAGTEERAFAALRHGAAAAGGHYRLWVKAFARDESVGESGRRGNDDWRGGRLGLRGDWLLGANERLMVDAALYTGDAGDRWNIPDPATATGFRSEDQQQKGRGGHVLGRYDWVMADGSEAALQAYLEDARLQVAGAIDERRTSVDLDFQHRFLGGGHDVVWGVGFRDSRDDIDSGGIIRIEPRSRAFRLLSAFAQDDITLMPEQLRLMLGMRLEHNSFTGFEPQPNLRLMWTPAPNQAVWGAVSRAVRTPSRTERDAQLDLAATPAVPPLMPPVLMRNVPRADRALQSERVTAFELGYRHQFDSGASLDLAGFHNRYERLRSARLGTPILGLPVVQEVIPGNDIEARAHGLEVAAEWHPAPWWRLQPSFTYLKVNTTPMLADPVNLQTAAAFENSAPRRQLSLRSSMTLARKHQFDLWLRHASGLGRADGRAAPIPAYTTVDLRYAWRAAAGLEIALVAQNLLDRRHPEFVPELLPSEPMQVQRGAYVKLKWQF